ncbi:NAD(P)H-dependent flavin oxidoreductase [Hypericibacter sp.]|uniref:NAD(P)H-dependent flavin oxidoreductase n=1 Tax=Hypericibacter sp. TaxID=2705401 RepID=UPI003D6D63D8
MKAWPDRRILDLFGIELPIIQAPMAGATTPEMVIAVSEAGGLGSLPTAQYSLDQMRDAVGAIRKGTARPINLNFFCHKIPAPDGARAAAWRARLKPYYLEKGLDPETPTPAAGRTPFDSDLCGLVETIKPEVVSFHFGLPEPALLARVKATGAKVIASATTVAEARWLEERGVDAVIAMGLEAGGHRGNFLSHEMASQVGTFALVPQVVDAVKVPVIAAGAVADARGIVAALALGASAVQIGTAYLFSPEAKLPAVHCEALKTAVDDNTMVTNVFTGRPARGIVNRLMREVGPLSGEAPAFPLAGAALGPLRAKAEAAGSGDFTNLWSGQAARLARAMSAGELTRTLAAEALARLGSP